MKRRFQWWHKQKTLFPIIGFLTHQILGIIESQIEMKRFFFFSRNAYYSNKMSFAIR
jgi:hypothetical protein